MHARIEPRVVTAKASGGHAQIAVPVRRGVPLDRGGRSLRVRMTLGEDRPEFRPRGWRSKLRAGNDHRHRLRRKWLRRQCWIRAREQHMLHADADRRERKRRSQQIPQSAHVRCIGFGTDFAEQDALVQGTRGGLPPGSVILRHRPQATEPHPLSQAWSPSPHSYLAAAV